MKYTIGSAGTRRTVGLPGTGLYYTERGRHCSHGRHAGGTAPPASNSAERLDLGFFKRLFTPNDEKHFVDGIKHVLEDNDAAAIAALDTLEAVADALFMAAMITLKAGRYADAVDLFDHAEAEQAQEHWPAALSALEALHDTEPSDAVVILSLVEILIEEPADEAAYRRVVELTQGIDNLSQLEAAILYWKGRALHQLDLPTAARDALTAAFRRRKDRDPELLTAIQYERALVYDALGQHSRAREEFGRIYAADPGYEDIAEQVD